MAGFVVKDYWEKRLRQNYDLSGVGYLGLGKAYNNWMYKLRDLVFSQTVSKLGMDLPRAGVLDIGSGTGFYIDCWQKLGAGQIAGADLSAFAVEKLAQRFPKYRFSQLDISAEAPPAGQTFDAISCMDVLFHIVDDARFHQAIRNIAALLKPGGYFIYSDNFIHGETVRGEHQVSRSLVDIEGALAQAGLEVKSRRPAFVLMNAPTDDTPVIVTKLWQKVMRQMGRTEVTGWLGGFALYHIDKFLISKLDESPTTEIMVCRKRS